ncbi:Response regulatory domain-containing protein [Sphingomonas antarctica]|uniref:response regulator n=1 Tax=Sphingomonas antarctica TaxID=2040274 RepID=UPI0039E96BD0
MNEASTILLVEDNPDDVELIRYAFAKAGIPNPLVVATDGDDAVNYVSGTHAYTDRRCYPHPALVLLDLKLPRRSGFEVLDYIRQHKPIKTVPVVVLTSSNQPEDIEAAYASGANSYLVKPVNRDGLLEMVKSIEAYWIKINRVTGE